MTITVSELGAELQSLTAVLRTQLGIDKGGAALKRLSDESPLKRIGLRQHDIILEVNEREISDVSDLANAFSAFGNCDKVKIRLIRGGKETIIIGTWGSEGELQPEPQSKPKKDYRGDEPEQDKEEQLEPLDRPRKDNGEKPKKRPKRRYF
jgi:C-terminal processing protease CtpA/Prc